MLNEATASKRHSNSTGGPAGQACGSYVPGYVPVAINRDVVDTLRQFRRDRLNVDLRIERAMVSAGVEMCIDDQGMREMLKMSTQSVLRSTDAPMLRAMTDRQHNAPVLIRRSVKKSLRDLAGAWNLGVADETINNLMVSAAINLVLATEQLHSKWVQLIAKTVADEVHEGFQGGSGSGS